MALITARFDSKCGGCGLMLREGEIIYYNRAGERGKKAFHPACQEGVKPPQQEPQQEEPARPPAPAREKAPTDTTGGMYRDHHESVADICALSVSPGRNTDIWKSVTVHDTKAGHTSNDWFGIEGGAAAVVQAVERGWPEGVERLESALSAMSVRPPRGIKRRIRRSDVGEYLDDDAARMGAFDRAWVSKPRQVSPNGRMRKTILVNLSANCNVEAEELFWRGAAALMLLDGMEQAGYATRLVGLFSSTGITANATGTELRTVIVKDYQHQIDKSNIASVVCLAGFFRYYGFKAKLSMPIDISKTLGRASTMVPDEYETDETIFGLEEIYNQRSAQEFITSTLEGLEESVSRAA